MKMAKFSFLKRKEQLAVFLFFSLFGLRSFFFWRRGEREREMSLTDCQLFEAVKEGDCEKAKQLLLNQKVDVNQSPRHQVVQSLSPFVFFWFVLIFFVIDHHHLCVYDHHHYHLWWWFCVSLCVCWVVILIWKFWEKKGITPLMRACEKGDLKMITLLIENGASLKSHARVFFSFFFF